MKNNEIIEKKEFNIKSKQENINEIIDFIRPNLDYDGIEYNYLRELHLNEY